ncbi:hypothetical protein EDD21DRAFT_393512 [Dissophora ornata]|nr:hypothetical protein EDD21DRAFT_393512 [Dissophora ornata]
MMSHTHTASCTSPHIPDFPAREDHPVLVSSAVPRPPSSPLLHDRQCHSPRMLEQPLPPSLLLAAACPAVHVGEIHFLDNMIFLAWLLILLGADWYAVGALLHSLRTTLPVLSRHVSTAVHHPLFPPPPLSPCLFHHYPSLLPCLLACACASAPVEFDMTACRR